MNRSSITVRIARLVQFVPMWLFRFIEWPFVAVLQRETNKTPAIFILALPRSGSTLTYQAICHGLHVNYLSNLWHLLYQLPLLGGCLSAITSVSHCSDFQSQQGFVSGLDGPAEGVRFWQWWLDCGLSDSDCERVPESKRQRRAIYIRKVLSTLHRRHGPFATAYLGHTLVPDRVYDAFPNAVFIRLRRDPISNALSLLESMRTSDAKWFSVLPRECVGLESASEYERVAAQVYWLNHRLDNAACAPEMLTVRYERLCQNPTRELDRIRNWCDERGIAVHPKYSLPTQFQYKMADINADQDALMIRDAMDKLEEQYGKLAVAV